MNEDAGATFLDDLVRRTAGFRPWRKLVHVATGLAIASWLSFTPVGGRRAVAVLAAVAAVLVAADLARLRIPRVNRLFFRLFAPLASPREAAGIASSTWYVLGVLAAVALFPEPHAISGVLVLALADPAASWAGSRGGRPFLGGTLVGTLAFLLVAAVVLALRHEPITALATAAAVTLVERRAWPLDDNLVVPAACAAVLTAIDLVA